MRDSRRHPADCCQALGRKGALFGIFAFLQFTYELMNRISDPSQFRIRGLGDFGVQTVGISGANPFDRSDDPGDWSCHLFSHPPAEGEQKHYCHEYAYQCRFRNGSPVGFKHRRVNFHEDESHGLTILASYRIDQDNSPVALIELHASCNQ